MASEDGMTEIRFVPDDKAVLDTLFRWEFQTIIIHILNFRNNLFAYLIES